MFIDFATTPIAHRGKFLTAAVTPRPIAWVVSMDAQGGLNAAPFSFFNVMCEDPPTLAFCPSSPGAEGKDTARNIRETGCFVVNLVSYANAQAMNITAIDFPRGVNELEQAGLATLPSEKIKVPRIAASPVAFECETHSIVQLAPGRDLIIGRILAGHIADDCIKDPAKFHIDTPRLDLIGRMHGGGWYLRNTDRFEMKRIPLAQWETAKAAE